MARKDDDVRAAAARRMAPTFIERALSKVAPKAAQRMHQSRMQFEMQATFGRAVGGYIGARRDRAPTAEWTPGGGSPLNDINPDLPMLRERSRDQMRNAAVAVGGLNTDVLHVVGTGLSYTPVINAARLGLTEEAAHEWTEDTRDRFKVWAESRDCHLQRQLDFYSVTELAYRSWLESGDVFVLTPVIQRGGRDQLVLQLIEADRVCNPGRKSDTETMQDGIELDPQTGEAIAIHVAKFHPGDRRAQANSWERVRIRGDNGRLNVIHLFDCLRPGQVRGVPWVAPILEVLKQIGKWSDAELNAAVVSSLWAVFVKMDADAFQDIFAQEGDNVATRLVDRADKWSGTIDGSGKALNLLPGEDISTATPGRPNPEFDPFWTAMVRQVGMTLGVPYEVLVMHFQSSYTAARGAFMMAWRRWHQRRDKVAKGLCQPVLDLWMAQEVAQGNIACPGFFANPVVRARWTAAMWTGDGPGSVDPVKEVTAAKMRVELGISTLQAESILHDGQDWEGKQHQRAKEVAQQRADGTLATATSSPPVADADAPDDMPDPSEDNSDAPPAPRRDARGARALHLEVHNHVAPPAAPEVKVVAMPQAPGTTVETAVFERDAAHEIRSVTKTITTTTHEGADHGQRTVL